MEVLQGTFTTTFFNSKVLRRAEHFWPPLLLNVQLDDRGSRTGVGCEIFSVKTVEKNMYKANILKANTRYNYFRAYLIKCFV